MKSLAANKTLWITATPINSAASNLQTTQQELLLHPLKLLEKARSISLSKLDRLGSNIAYLCKYSGIILVNNLAKLERLSISDSESIMTSFTLSLKFDVSIILVLVIMGICVRFGLKYYFMIKL
jgi:hypothetical protein